jgi:hypothetical protein
MCKPEVFVYKFAGSNLGHYTFKVMNVEELHNSLRDEIRSFFFTLSLKFLSRDTLSLVTPLSLIISLSFLNLFPKCFKNEVN